MLQRGRGLPADDLLEEALKLFPQQLFLQWLNCHLAIERGEGDSARTQLEALAAIDAYRQELVPLIVPLTLVRHYVRVHDVSYLSGQLYLEPHPRELMLRNHV